MGFKVKVLLSFSEEKAALDQYLQLGCYDLRLLIPALDKKHLKLMVTLFETVIFLHTHSESFSYAQINSFTQ